MTRTKKDPVLLAQMCARLSAVMDLLDMSDSQLSERLGYANSTTLSGVRRGAVFPDVERLAHLGKIVLSSRFSPNLHWVLTGAGMPFLQSEIPKATDLKELEALNRMAIMKLAARPVGKAYGNVSRIS